MAVPNSPEAFAIAFEFLRILYNSSLPKDDKSRLRNKAINGELVAARAEFAALMQKRRETICRG